MLSVRICCSNIQHLFDFKIYHRIVGHPLQCTIRNRMAMIWNVDQLENYHSVTNLNLLISLLNIVTVETWPMTALTWNVGMALPIHKQDLMVTDI